MPKGKNLIVLLTVTTILVSVIALAQTRKATLTQGIVVQDSNGVQSTRTIGRGLYLDPTNNSIRTLSWGGLYNPRPGVLWMTTGTGGNAQPVVVDPSKFIVSTDPSGAAMLAIAPTAGAAFDLRRASNGASVTVGVNCSAGTPCNYGSYGQVLQLTLPISITSTTQGSDTVFVYIDPDGIIGVGSNSTSVQCTTPCTVGTGVIAFPSGVIPLYTLSIVNGVFTTTVVDWRCSACAYPAAQATVGIALGINGGSTTIGIDQTVVPTWTAAVPATSSSPCIPITLAADASFLYVCTSTNHWVRSPIGAW